VLPISVNRVCNIVDGSIEVKRTDVRRWWSVDDCYCCTKSILSCRRPSDGLLLPLISSATSLTAGGQGVTQSHVNRLTDHQR